MKIIGFTGAQGCGKNTVADYLKRHAFEHGHGAVTIAFADSLRDVTEAVFGSRYDTQESKANVDQYWDERLFHPKDRRSEGPESMLGDVAVTGRRILQFVGTEMFRSLVHPSVWLFAMERRISRGHPNDLVCITDIRFDNEAHFVKDRGGFVIHLLRHEKPAPVGQHASDAGVSPSLIDHHISVGEGLARATAEILYRSLVSNG